MRVQTRPLGYHMGEALGVCMRCGATRFVSQLKREWTGLLVDDRCWDPRPPQLSPPNVIAEGLPVPNASPRPAPIFIFVSEDPIAPPGYAFVLNDEGEYIINEYGAYLVELI